MILHSILFCSFVLQIISHYLTSTFSLYPRKRSLRGVYWNQPVGWSVGRSVMRSVCRFVGRFVGRSVCKILSAELLLQYQSDSIDTLHNCSPGWVDVQDTNFTKICPIITELLPLIQFEKYFLTWKNLVR